MFSDSEAMNLLCHGHALEWTGVGWRMSVRPEQAAPVHHPEARDTAPPVGAPSATMACSGSRVAALLNEACVLAVA